MTGAALGALPAAKWTGKADGEAQGALAFGLPVGILVERLMEHGTGLGLGRYVSSPALIATGFFPEAGGDFVHPVYLYEAAAAVILLAVTAFLSRRKERSGSWLLQTFLVLFGLTQVLLESLRADGHMLEHFVHLQQVYAILLAAGGILGWTVRGRERKTWQKLAGWAGILAAAGVGIWAEFGVDRWGNPLLAYGLMTASMIVIGGIGHWLRGKEKAAA